MGLGVPKGVSLMLHQRPSMIVFIGKMS